HPSMVVLSYDSYSLFHLKENSVVCASVECNQHAKEELYCASEARILIVDDDESVCRMIQEAVGQHGFTVEVVSQPEEVEARLKSQAYHVIILDYCLPTLGTEQVLGWLHDHQ